MAGESSVSSSGQELPEELLKKLRIQVPGYQLLDQIGSGGQARVYKAVRSSDSLVVAIKVLQDGLLATDEARARFQREVITLKALNHPGIVPIIDHGQTSEGYDFIVMQFIDGRSLDQFILDRRFLDSQSQDPNALLRLFAKICAAVNFAHRAGITHRDLSPSNILIDSDGNPHIIDFGLARTAFDTLMQPNKQVSITGQFLGKLAYAAPEQVQGKSEKIDIRTDVYALGIILYEMLTGGRFPYVVIGDMAAVLDAIIKSHPTPPSKRLAASVATEAHASRRIKLDYPSVVNELIDAIVLKALAKNPADRYQSAGAFGEDIENYLAGKPVTATSSPVKPEPIRITVDNVKRKPDIVVNIAPTVSPAAPANPTGAQSFFTPRKIAALVGVVVLIGAIILIATTISRSSQRQAMIAAIERVLGDDNRTASGATTTAEVIAKMRSIDLTGCPDDFKLAYIDHIHAWETKGSLERQMLALQNQSNSSDASTESFIRGFFGDPAGKYFEELDDFKQISKKITAASDQIRVTYQHVQDVAVSYGASIPSD